MRKRRDRISVFDFDQLKKIIAFSEFQSMKNLPHHGIISCYDHSILVAQKALNYAHRRDLDYLSAATGGLLHDLYLYHKRSMKGSLHRYHHPVTALRNAEKHFDFALNEIIRDAILHHMWPLTPIKPRYPESMMVTYADKASTFVDYKLSAGMNFKRIYHNRLI